jgi:hypothetical protein
LFIITSVSYSEPSERLSDQRGWGARLEQRLEGGMAKSGGWVIKPGDKIVVSRTAVIPQRSYLGGISGR